MRKLTNALLRRRKTLIFLSLVTFALVGPYLTSRIRSSGRRVQIRMLDAVKPPHGSQSADRTLRIVTYNIAHGRGPIDENWAEAGDAKRSRIEEIAELFRTQQADIVILNEVDFSATWSGHQNQAEAIARQCGFSYWVEQRNLDFRFICGSWKFGNAILSRFPIVDAELVEFPALKTWEDWLAGHKRGLVATLQIEPERRIRVLAVHLEHRSEDLRVESARQIVELAATSSIPLIAAGDFNSTPPGWPQSETSSAGDNAMAILEESAHFHPLTGSDFDSRTLTYPSTSPQRAIDWILVSTKAERIERQVLKSDLSDHRPVMAIVKLREIR